MPGKLYVVGTPIGNLEDITYRAVRILSEVDFICAEDTRVTVKLLNHFDIKKPLLSYHEHSASHVSENIISRRDLDIPVEAVPGPTAMATAAAVCGIPASRFAFEGFLSVTKKQRFEHLKSVSKDTHTLIFYEAPHKLRSTLEDMLKYFGDRRISICRELTKIHEEVMRTTLSQAIEYYEQNAPRGEYVLVVEGMSAEELKDEYSVEEAADIARKLIEGGAKMSDACKEAARITGVRKNDIYTAVM